MFQKWVVTAPNRLVKQRVSPETIECKALLFSQHFFKKFPPVLIVDSSKAAFVDPDLQKFAAHTAYKDIAKPGSLAYLTSNKLQPIDIKQIPTTKDETDFTLVKAVTNWEHRMIFTNKTSEEFITPLSPKLPSNLKDVDLILGPVAYETKSSMFLATPKEHLDMPPGSATNIPYHVVFDGNQQLYLAENASDRLQEYRANLETVYDQLDPIIVDLELDPSKKTLFWKDILINFEMSGYEIMLQLSKKHSHFSSHAISDTIE